MPESKYPSLHAMGTRYRDGRIVGSSYVLTTTRDGVTARRIAYETDEDGACSRTVDSIPCPTEIATPTDTEPAGMLLPDGALAMTDYEALFRKTANLPDPA